jgi:hypothetical protein
MFYDPFITIINLSRLTIVPYNQFIASIVPFEEALTSYKMWHSLVLSIEGK